MWNSFRQIEVDLKFPSVCSFLDLVSSFIISYLISMKMIISVERSTPSSFLSVIQNVGIGGLVVIEIDGNVLPFPRSPGTSRGPQAGMLLS